MRRQRQIGGPSLAGRQGLSSEEVEWLARRQGGACLICQKPPTAEGWAVDHDHALAERDGHDPKRGCRRCVRGLLCKPCNLVLGWARDDPATLERAAAYLRVRVTKRATR